MDNVTKNLSDEEYLKYSKERNLGLLERKNMEKFKEFCKNALNNGEQVKFCFDKIFANRVFVKFLCFLVWEWISEVIELSASMAAVRGAKNSNSSEKNVEYNTLSGFSMEDLKWSVEYVNITLPELKKKRVEEII